MLKDRLNTGAKRICISSDAFSTKSSCKDIYADLIYEISDNVSAKQLYLAEDDFRFSGFDEQVPAVQILNIIARFS